MTLLRNWMTTLGAFFAAVGGGMLAIPIHLTEIETKLCYLCLTIGTGFGLAAAKDSNNHSTLEEVHQATAEAKVVDAPKDKPA